MSSHSIDVETHPFHTVGWGNLTKLGLVAENCHVWCIAELGIVSSFNNVWLGTKKYKDTLYVRT